VQHGFLFVDPRWHSFDNFLEDMGPCPENHEFHRLEPRLMYGPGNGEWREAGWLRRAKAAQAKANKERE